MDSQKFEEIKIQESKPEIMPRKEQQAEGEIDLENIADKKISEGEVELNKLEHGRNNFQEIAKKYDETAGDLYNRFDEKMYSIYERGKGVFKSMAEKIKAIAKANDWNELAEVVGLSKKAESEKAEISEQKEELKEQTSKPEKSEPADKEIKAEAETETTEKSRYREKITNPEALSLVDENSEKFKNELTQFELDIESFKTKITGNLSENFKNEDEMEGEIKKLLYKNASVAGGLMYGFENKRAFRHFNIPNLQEMKTEFKEEYEEKLKEGYTRCLGNKSPDEIKKTMDALDKRLEELKNDEDKEFKRQFELKKNFYFDRHDASLYAIGVKEQDYASFLKNQANLKEIIENIKNKNKDTGKWAEEHFNRYFHYNENDFKLVRHRAYYEARRTGKGVFTHVTNPSKVEKIIKDNYLRGSTAFSKGEEYSEMKKAGQTGNIDEFVYFKGNGADFSYGTKIEQGFAVSKKGKDIVFFARLGNDFLVDGMSVAAVNPSRRSEETPSGKYEDGILANEINLKDLYLVVPESEKENYVKILKENNYDEGYIKDNLVVIPEKIIQQAEEEGGRGGIRGNSEVLNKFVNVELKKYAFSKSKNRDKIFATTAGRQRGVGFQKIYKWQQIN